MDRKILTVSIMTILVLLGALFVFAVVGMETATILSNVTTNGSAANWSAGGDASIGGNILKHGYSNITFEFKLDHRTATIVASNNITNITIRPHGMNSTAGTVPDIGNLTMEDAINATFTQGDGSITASNYADIECKILGGNGKSNTIQCLNKSGNIASNLTGNGTYKIWARLDTNTTAREQVYNWIIQVTDNDTDFSSNTISTWGIDGLAPRFIEFNISDDTNTWTSRKDEINGSAAYTIDANDSIVIKFMLNESNRKKGKVLLFWNTTTGADLINLSAFNDAAYNFTVQGGNGTADLTVNTSCNPRNTDYSSQVCTYDYHISAGNFTKDGRQITFAIWTNDSFNHTSTFNSFNVTIDVYNPGATVNVDKPATAYVQGDVTVSCTATDTNATSTVVTEQIVLVKPNDAEVKVSDKESYIFRNDDTGIAGEYGAYCKVRDIVGKRTTSATEKFTIYYRTGGSGPSGAPSSVADVDVSTATAGVAGGKQGESETFTIDGITAHRLTFLEIGTNSATILIESDPIEFTLNVGESEEVTLDGATIRVTLDSIDNGKASVTIVNVAAEAAAAAGEETTEEVVSEGGISTWLIVLIIVVVVVVLYFVIKGRKGKKGEVKFSRQELN